MSDSDFAEKPDETSVDLNRIFAEYASRVQSEGPGAIAKLQAEFLRDFPGARSELLTFFSRDDEVHEDPSMTAKPGDPQSFPRHVRYIGSFELLEMIGRGGMGEVYRAKQSTTDRIVALKLSRNNVDVKRFEREIKIAASLDHPNIVTLLEANEDQGLQYFAMAYVEGGSLVGRKDLSAHETASIGVKLCDALTCAHEKGIIHRDIKPDNILLNEQGEPMLADFGIARLVDGSDRMTASEAIVGTPHFMSPEQASGQNSELTAATDIYSLGATLFYLLCGDVPFRGDGQRLQKRIQFEKPDFGKTRVDRDLANIVLKCLEKLPTDRYGTAGALSGHLQLFLEGRPVPVRRIGPVGRTLRWAKRSPSLASMVFTILMLAGIACYFFVRHELAKSDFQVRDNLKAQQRYADDLRETKRLLDQGQPEALSQLQPDESVEVGWEFGHLHAFTDVVEDVRTTPDEDHCFCVAVSENSVNHPKLGLSSMIAAGAESGVVYVWYQNDRGQTTRTKLVPRRLAVINAVEISNQGRLLAAGDANGRVSVWDTRKPGAPIFLREFSGAKQIRSDNSSVPNRLPLITSIAISHDEAETVYIAVASTHDVITIVEQKTWKVLRQIEANDVRCLSFAATARQPKLIAGDGEGSIQLHSLTDEPAISIGRRAHPGGLHDVAVNGNRITSCGVDGGLQLWGLGNDAVTWGPLERSRFPQEIAGSLSAEGQIVVRVGLESKQRVSDEEERYSVFYQNTITGEVRWMKKTGRSVVRETEGGRCPICCATSANLSVVGCGPEISFFRVRPALQVAAHAQPVIPLYPGLFVSFQKPIPDPVIANDVANTAFPLDVRNGVRGVIVGHETLATYSSDGAIDIWNCDDSRPDLPLQRILSFPINEMFPNQDSPQVAAACFSRDRSVLMLGLKSGELAHRNLTSDEVRHFAPQQNPVLKIALSADNQLAMITTTQTVSVVDMRSDDRVHVIRQGSGQLDSSLHPPTGQVAVAFEDGVVRVFRADAVQLAEFRWRPEERPRLRNPRLVFHPTEHRLFGVVEHQKKHAVYSELLVWDPRSGQTMWQTPWHQPQRLGHDWLGIHAADKETTLIDLSAEHGTFWARKWRSNNDPFALSMRQSKSMEKTK